MRFTIDIIKNEDGSYQLGIDHPKKGARVWGCENMAEVLDKIEEVIE